MIAASLPEFLWAEILLATNLLRNMTPVTNLSRSPFELWNGRKPDLSKLRVLGYKTFCPIEKSARGGKFGAVGYRGVLVNYSSGSPAYRVWHHEKQKVYDVAAPAFDEAVEPGWWREAHEPEEEELLYFPVFVPPPAAPSAPVSEVIDISPEQDSPADAESAPPAEQEEFPGPAAATPEELQDADEDEDAVPPPAAVGPRRSTRGN